MPYQRAVRLWRALYQAQNEEHHLPESHAWRATSVEKGPLATYNQVLNIHCWRTGAVEEACWAVKRTLTISRV